MEEERAKKNQHTLEEENKMGKLDFTDRKTYLT